MEDQINTMETRVGGTVLSGFAAAIAWINLQNFQTLMAIAASAVAVVSGCLAGYSWYLTIQEKRLRIQNHKKSKP